MTLVSFWKGAAASAAALVFSCAASAQDLIVKIGHAGPLSGAQARSGQDNERGVRMALDELNGANVLIGGRRARFELMSEDDQADPKSGVQAAQKLVDTGVRAVIGHYNSGVSIPAARVYQQAGIPMVTGASSNPQLTKLGYDHIFRLAANDNVMGAAMAEFAKARGFTRIAVIDDRTAYGQGVAEVFIQTANRLGLTIVGREYTSDKSADFTSVLTKLRGENPDVLFFGGYYAQAGVMARQVRQLGLRAVMMGGDGICSPEVITLGATQLEGRFFCAQGGRPLDALPGGPAYRERFLKAFKAPVDTYAPAFYVATLAVARAMQDAGSDDPKKFVPALKAVRFDSLLGPVQFDGAGDWVNAPVSLYQIEGARLTPLPAAR